MTCGFTKTHDGLDLDLLIFMSGEVQQEIQHFVLDDNLRDTWRASDGKLQHACMEVAKTR